MADMLKELPKVNRGKKLNWNALTKRVGELKDGMWLSMKPSEMGSLIGSKSKSRLTRREGLDIKYRTLTDKTVMVYVKKAVDTKK
mgnify:CR=1 FL=1